MSRPAYALPFAITAVLLHNTVAHADTSTDEARARLLFDEGKRLLKAGALEQALDRFRASRALHPGKGNTQSAIYCLIKIHRWDEALEMYEELLGRFGDKLSEKDRVAVAEYMTTFRREVGSLDVSANVQGQILVDGRLRGLLPLSAALHVLPGEHLVRIVKEGYAPYEKTVKISVGRTTAIDAQLVPLGSVGRLRVEVDPEGVLAAGALSIDGSPFGSLPWEGNLAPGPHVLFASSGDKGSGLVRVVVVQSQLVTITLTTRRLGMPVRLQVEPPAAQISIDRVAVGRGGFEGRLPLGDHDVSVREDGYTTASFTLRSTHVGAEDRRVSLVVDPRHPRWTSGARFCLEALAAPLFAASLGSYAEERARGAPAYGGAVAARFGFEFPVRLALDASAGWLVVARTATRSLPTAFHTKEQIVPVRYDVEDRLHVQGPFAGLGLRQRIPFGRDRFDLRLGLGFAVAVLTAGDLSSTTATSAGMSTPATTDMNGVRTTTVTMFLMPEFDMRYRVGPIDFGVGLGAVALLFEGRPLSSGETRVHGCPRTIPSDVRCAPGTMILEDMRAFGRFVAWAPHVALGWTL